AIWIEDVTRHPEFLRAHPGDTVVRAGRLFPIMAGPEVVGVLEFYSAEPSEPDAALVDVISQAGVQIGRVVERVRAERALRLSEAKFSGIISIASDAIVSVDEDQRIILYNHGAEQIFGYTAEEVVGKPLDIL